ncbi:MAG: STAS domain-containing protein [Armatimonadota bacterium]
MKIRTEEVDECRAICRVSGELDAYTAPDLRDALDRLVEDGRSWIIADLTELTYIDSTGLGILVGTAKKCRQADGDLAVACVRRNLLKIFQISGTQEILNVVPDVKAATARLEDLERARSADADEGGA